MPRIGFISLGKSSDAAFTPVLRSILDSTFSLYFQGCLDNLSAAQIEELAANGCGGQVAVRLADGSSAQISGQLLVPIINNIMQKMAGLGLKGACLMCVATLDNLEIPTNFLLLRGQETLDNAIRTVCPVGAALGVMTPFEDQEGIVCEKYRKMGYEVVGGHADPNGDISAFAENCRKFVGCQAICLHSMDYDSLHKTLASKIAGCVALQANALMGRLAAAIFS